MLSGTTSPLMAVWGSSGSDVFAVGMNGIILHYDGTSWNAMSSGIIKYLSSVWGSSPNDVFVVGYGGAILHYGPKTWHVDDDLADYPDADFTMIQDAVDAASSGDTIIVYPGTYTENVDVNKDYLTIQSENGAEATIVLAANSDDHVFEVTADYVNISGFMVTGAMVHWPSSGIYLGSVSYCDISQNIILDNSNGISLEQSSNNTVANNAMNANEAYGIFLESSANNILTGNIISDNEMGIYLGSDSSYNIVSGNTIKNHSYGMWIATSFDNRVYFNNFRESSEMHVFSAFSTNAWNSPEEVTYTYNGTTYTSYLGNYWDDYFESDADGDGIGDTPYSVDSDNDNYPLVEPFENYVIGPAVGTPSVSIVPDTQTVAAGGSCSVDVVVDSAGTPIKTCEVVVTFDADLTATGLTGADLLGTAGLDALYIPTIDIGEVSYAGVRIDDFIGVNGNFVTIDFDVDLAAAGTYPLVVDATLLDENGDPILGVILNDGEVVSVPPGDTTPPFAVTDLAAGEATTDSITLTWTSPGDDGNFGTASEYDIRYSTSEITEANWDSATQATGEPAPQLAGSMESFIVGNLTPGTTYYFALKTADEVPNWSGLSNVVSVITSPELKFSAEPTSGVSPLTVQFIDESPHLFSSWEWDFNNDGIVDSREQNPTYTYGAGTYTVRLTASGTVGTGTRIKTDYITVEAVSLNEEPIALFSCSPSEPRAGEEVILDASASDDPDGRVEQYEWDLDGDGDYDGLTTSPKIYYYWSESGVYHVTLRVTDDDGGRSTYSVDVTVREMTLWEKVKGLFSPSVKELSKEDWARFQFIKSELRISNWPHSDEPSSDPDFYWVDDNKLLTILKKEIDRQASELTYEMHIMDTLHDMRLADSIAGRAFTVDPIINQYFDNMADLNIWVKTGLMVSKEAMTQIIKRGMGGRGIGIGPILMLWDLAQAGVGIEFLDQTFYKRALWHYFELRDSWPSQEAFGLSPVPAKYDNEPTRNYFEELWSEYGGSHISSSGGLKQDLKEQVIQQLRLLLLSGLEQHKFEPYHVYQVKSPAELRVFDSLGQVTGLVNGEPVEEIPNSAYDDENGTILVYPATDFYHCVLVGTADGTYGLSLTAIEDGEAITFNAVDIPILMNAIHQYTIDWVALSEGMEGVTIQIDSDGDGIFEESISADNALTHDEFMLQTETTVDLDPDTLNLKSKGKFVTVYIELPPGYDVGQIDVSSILLNGTVPALSRPTQVGDNDSDGVPDLMVKFHRTAVQEILTVGEEVGITIRGEIAGIVFEGSDTIKVIDKT